MAKQGFSGGVFMKSGTPTLMAAPVSLTNSGDNLRYQISDATKRYWQKSAAVTVEKSIDSGVTWSTITTGFNIEYCGGFIVFTSVQNVAHQFRVTATYYTVTEVMGMYEWELELKNSDLTMTNFGSNGAKEILPGILEGEGKAAWYWADSSFLGYVQDPELVFVLYVDKTAPKQRYEFYGILTGGGPKVKVEDLIQEEIKFASSGGIYYREG